MTLRRGLRNWLLAKDSDPSVRLRVLRDLLERPADDPAVVGALREIGRKGVGGTDSAGPACIGAVGERGLVRIRTVPAEVRGNELEAARPFGLGPHEEDPPGRQSGAPLPGPLLPIR